MEQNTRNIILSLAQKNRQVIYGGQSTNIQLPKHLRRDTSDYDILTKKPKFFAEKLASMLNKEYRNNDFKVEEAFHKGTYKVKDSKGNTLVDYTYTTKKPKSKLVLGVRYADVNYSERKLKKILKDESSSFRHEKDLNTIKRIKEYKNIKLW